MKGISSWSFLSSCVGLLLILCPVLAFAVRPMFLATITAEAVSATTRYVLVDLSDTSAYKHTESNGLRLYRLCWNTDRTIGGWDLHFGLVLENDATDGSAQWFYSVQIENDPATAVSHRESCFDFSAGDDGYQLMRISSSAAVRSVSNELTGNVTWLQNDAADLADATGSTTKSAGAGDLVMEAEEVSGAGALDFSVSVLYSAE